MSDPHLGFIVASYAIGFVVVAGLIVWTVLDHRVQARALERLEARSGRRRGRP
ncbi:heme exporter protein CcmD [Hansschlegelia sp.]|uniref:heme exporter protein CcmD n=1 Tax=Hansschlegelia sp. TaxID=2041892 RepID=UPI002CB2BDED|nr:heme exporter protein CcmD [Hansschlegelia sp.]HVI29752.1 heme exporter protein CcmD [Hansschlegelia sp.]